MFDLASKSIKHLYIDDVNISKKPETVLIVKKKCRAGWINFMLVGVLSGNAWFILNRFNLVKQKARSSTS